MKQLARRLRKAREATGKSQADLADELGVSDSTIAGWELGTHNVRMARLPKLAKALNVDVSYLVGGKAA